MEKDVSSRADSGTALSAIRTRAAISLLCLLIFVGAAGCTAGSSPTAQPSTAILATPFPTGTASLFDAGMPTQDAVPPPTPSSIPTLAQTTDPTPVPTAMPTVAATLTAMPTLTPERWMEWPVLPELSARARQMLRDAPGRGLNSRAFAKVGDCETLTDWFLVDFDRGPRYYNLGSYASLQRVIDTYAGSFQRKSLASARGFTAASALSPIWADPTACKPGETPLACEIRVQRPAFALIMLGTNDVNHKATFEANLRKIIEYSLEQGVLPVLVTKADNLEGDHQLNLVMARLAAQYEVPLWNFWLAVQPLPDHGLQPDGAHLTYTPNRFDDPRNLKSAWAVRNLNALQLLEILWKASED